MITCLHDYQPHPGEKWPRKNSIFFRVYNSDAIIAFSDFIAERFRNYTSKPVYVSSLPLELARTGEVGVDVKEVLRAMNLDAKPKILLIGRMKAYKDTSKFFESAIRMSERALFVIAGEGAHFKRQKLPPLVINRWLTNNEFTQLMQHSDIICLPYSEASQSGIIPLAIRLGKIVVSTEQPGLMEQLSNYTKKVTYNSERLAEMDGVIDSAINMLIQPKVHSNVGAQESRKKLAEVITLAQENLS